MNTTFSHVTFTGNTTHLGEKLNTYNDSAKYLLSLVELAEKGETVYVQTEANQEFVTDHLPCEFHQFVKISDKIK